VVLGFPTTCRKQNTWPTSPTRLGDVPAKVGHSARSGSWPRPSAAGGAKRPIILGAAACCGPARGNAVISSPIAAGLALQHAARARLFHDHPFGPAPPAATSRRWAGRCTSPRTSSRGRHELSYYVGGGHSGESCKIQLDDAHAAARWAEGRDIYVRSDARAGVEAILAGLDGSWASASRRRRPYARKCSRIASRPSPRTRCRSTSRPGAGSPRGDRAIDAVVQRMGYGGRRRSPSVFQHPNAWPPASATRRSVNSARSQRPVLCAGGRGLRAGRAREAQERAVRRRRGPPPCSTSRSSRRSSARAPDLDLRMNDGGYRSEFHSCAPDGSTDSLAVFGRPALETSPRLGLRGTRYGCGSVVPKLFADFVAQATAKSGTSRSPIRSRPGDPPAHQARARQYVALTSGAHALRGDIQIGAGAGGDIGKRIGALSGRTDHLQDRALAISIHAQQLDPMSSRVLPGLGARIALMTLGSMTTVGTAVLKDR